jgi:outer membrane murein-binding lipoprotein Lpp
MSTPLELKVDRIEKLMVEAIEMIGRVENNLTAKIEAVDNKVDALADAVKLIRTDNAKAQRDAALRFVTYEEDLRQMRMEFKTLDERMRALEDRP